MALLKSISSRKYKDGGDIYFNVLFKQAKISIINNYILNIIKKI